MRALLSVLVLSLIGACSGEVERAEYDEQVFTDRPFEIVQAIADWSDQIVSETPELAEFMTCDDFTYKQRTGRESEFWVQCASGTYLVVENGKVSETFVTVSAAVDG